MHRLTNVVKPYAWGSRTAIAELRGLPSPAPTPEAELWMGAHPSSPSRITKDGSEVALDACILHDPEGELGQESLSTFGPKLPFLLKVLAAGAPLSLQAHPTAAQAKVGFARENAQGLALDAPTRSYKDDNHKPEVLCAVSPFWALSGFRGAAEAATLLAALEVPALLPIVATLRGPNEDGAKIREVFLALFAHPEKGRLASEVIARAEALGRHGFPAEAEWTARLGKEYPGDVGVVVALLLNLVRLAPGEALFLDAGNLHAYLEGTGIELMASSDNVLRGGLTVKHVDVGGLAEVLEFAPTGIPRARRVATPEGTIEYRTSAKEFLLARLMVDGSRPLPKRTGPQILLAVGGSVVVSRGTESLVLRSGESAYLPHSAEGVTVSGQGTLFRGTTAIANDRANATQTRVADHSGPR